MIAIPFALLLIVVAIAWFVEAPREAKLIAQNMGGDDLDHSELMWRRLLSIGSLALLAWYLGSIGQSWQNSLWPELRWMLACCVIAWASFNITHRFRLNTLRKMDWRYVSPGNWYDFAAMVALGEYWLPHGKWTWSNWKACVIAQHHLSYDLLPRYQRYIHRAGTLAYCFETLVLAASIVGVVAILHWGVPVAEPTAPCCVGSVLRYASDPLSAATTPGNA